MRMYFLRWAPVAAAVIGLCAVSMAGARAESEVIIRSAMPFDACPAKVDQLLTQLGADERNIRVTRDTGAHYGLKLVAVSANLEFLCNAVTETIEVTRTTPGELTVAEN